MFYSLFRGRSKIVELSQGVRDRHWKLIAAHLTRAQRALLVWFSSKKFGGFPLDHLTRCNTLYKWLHVDPTNRFLSSLVISGRRLFLMHIFNPPSCYLPMCFCARLDNTGWGQDIPHEPPRYRFLCILLALSSCKSSCTLFDCRPGHSFTAFRFRRT